MANKYFRQALIPSAATDTTLYTVPTDSAAVVRSLRVTNADTGASSITVTQYNSGSATLHYLLKARNLSVNATYDVFNGVPLVLEGGDVLKVTSSAASVHFYLSYLEMDRT
jgi:hypothetical protein